MQGSKQADNQATEKKATEKPTKQKAAKPKLTRKEKDAIMESLGLVKVKGAVSGRIYYE